MAAEDYRVEKILEEYGLSGARATLLRESADNAVYLIEGAEKKILRLGKRPLPEGVAFECEAVEHLARCGFPVAKWNRTKGGEICARCEDRIAVLFDFVPGYQARADKDSLPSAEECFVAGASLARLHGAGASLVTDAERARNVFTELERAMRYEEIFLQGIEGGEKFIGEVEEAISFGKKYGGATGLIQNDYRPGNVLFRDRDTVSGVIDFDWCCRGPLLKDLALALVEWSFPDGASAPDAGCSDAFLDGYDSAAQNKVQKDGKLVAWMRFAALSDAATYLCDLIDAGQAKKTIGSYMYDKYVWFGKRQDRL